MKRCISLFVKGNSTTNNGFGQRHNDNIAKAISEEKIVFGGCCITDNDPDFQCVECGALIFSKTGKFYFNEEEDF